MHPAEAVEVVVGAACPAAPKPGHSAEVEAADNHLHAFARRHAADRADSHQVYRVFLYGRDRPPVAGQAVAPAACLYKREAAHCSR